MVRKPVLMLVLSAMVVGSALLGSYALAQPAGGRHKGMMHGGPDAEVRQMHAFIGLLSKMRDVCFEPDLAGTVAVGGMKDDVKRPKQEVIKDYEDLLTKTRTLGLRNAIRLSLKDLYLEEGNKQKALEHLRAAVTENDRELQKRQASAER
jgi:hypothetical protein